MTDEQINERIALLCGWKGPFQQEWIPEYGRAAEPFYCFAGTDQDGDRYPLPNYAADLNAIREARKSLDYYMKSQLWDMLVTITRRDIKPDAGPMEAVILVGDLNARQECEAFLRVHGQWKEGV